MSDTQSISRSSSTASVTEVQPDPPPSKPKKERNALSQRLTKLSLFGRKRGKETQSPPSTLNEFMQGQGQGQTLTSEQQDDTSSSVCEEDGATILWEDDGNVKAATPVMLIRRITDEKFVDSNLLIDVIVAYRSFLTPNAFLELLMQRFEVSSPISLRVCAVLKAWIERQWCDFDTELVGSLLMFIKDSVQSKDILKNVAEQLLKLIGKKQLHDDGQRTVTAFGPPQPLLPLTVDEISEHGIKSHDLTNFGPDVTFWSFPTKEIARQLTLLEFTIFARIQYYELISQAWAREGSDTKAVNVLALISHFNKVSAWVCSEIVNTQDLQQRIERVLQLIDIAQHFFVMNNFNGLMAVLAGLHSSSVHRLRRTWAGVPEKSKETFEFLTEFMGSAKNYTQYREHLQKAILPVLPYLGVYLSDLTFIEEGNPGEIGHLVNFSKCRQIAAIIRKIVEFQTANYVFVCIPFVQSYFTNYAADTDKEAYEHSTKVEPRAQSTMVSSAAATSIASSAFSSLGSSVGIDKDYDPLEVVDVGAAESDKLVESVHVRFRKDLIRSRNNSLNNAGEPFCVKVQLPGSVPVEMRMPPTTTSQQAVKHFADFFSGLNEQYCLVVMPCREDAKGYIFTTDKVVKEVITSRERDRVNTKLALFAAPLVITCALFSGSVLGDCRDVLVDMAAPLFSMFALFQDILRISDDFAYLAYDQKAKQVWWINMHKSLEASYFRKPACILIIFPLSNFAHKNVETMGGGDKQGVLLSGGREGTLNTLKVATVRQLWAVLSGPFILCYKNKSDAAPSDVIVLDGFSIQASTSKHVSVLLDRNTQFPTAGTSNKSHYSLAAETDTETRLWLRACQRNRGVLGDKVVFGEELDKIAKHNIPAVVQKTVSFINSHALQVEGLFKAQPNFSLIQHYKNQFDQGVEVEFSRANDPCTIARLLLLFLDELPNPLLTYELFPTFMEFALKPPPQDNEVSVLRDIISSLKHSHVTVLGYLLAFLAQVSMENPIKGGIVNVFAPLLLRIPPLENDVKGYKEASRTVLRKLIQNREKIFAGISRRPESVNLDSRPLPTSNSPNNNNPQCKEFAIVIEKQLINNAAIAKRVELLKSQLESKYQENKYKSQLKRQVSFHEDIQNAAKQKNYNRNSPGYRNHKSVSYVTRPIFNENEESDSDIQHNPQVQTEQLQ